MKQVSENEIYLVDLFALSKHLQVLFLVISARNLHKFLSCFNFHRSEQVNRKYEVVLRKNSFVTLEGFFFFNRDKLLRIVVRVLTALFPLQILTALEQETVCIFFSSMNLYAGFFLNHPLVTDFRRQVTLFPGTTTFWYWKEERFLFFRLFNWRRKRCSWTVAYFNCFNASFPNSCESLSEFVKQITEYLSKS